MRFSPIAIACFFSFLIFGISPVLAHVTVKPNQVGVAAYQTFVMGVPVEKEVPTTTLRLVIPEGLKSVTPNVKPGWKIEIKRQSEGEAAKVTEITWTGGSIPSGQRDEFAFSAQAPAQETQLQWKAYQTYADGTVVNWDQDPNAQKSSSADNESSTPFSITKVVNDLKTDTNTTVPADENEEKENDRLPLILSTLALALSAITYFRVNRKTS